MLDWDDSVVKRLDAAVESLDKRAPMILAYHAAIERELDLALKERMPNPQFLRKLGFGQKVGVWAATQQGDPQTIEADVAPLLRFNDLRNAIAHGDDKPAVDALLKKLLESSGWGERVEYEDAVHFLGGWLFGIVNELE